MIKNIVIFIIPFLLFSCNGCNRVWTEKQRQEFAEKCAQTDTLDGLACFLTGFAYDEIRNITVMQIHNGQIVDSFSVQPHKDYDALRMQYSFHINKPMYIKDTFQVSVSGSEPYILSDIKMAPHPQYTMFSEGWGCQMCDYKINGVHFENGNPNFVKKEFELPITACRTKLNNNTMEKNTPNIPSLAVLDSADGTVTYLVGLTKEEREIFTGDG